MFRVFGALLALVAAAGADAATCTWTGNAADGDWSSSANWNNCGGAHALPIGGDTLVFPEVANRKTNANDLVGLQLASIQFNGLNYDISGNAITLSSGITVNTPIAGFTDKGPRFRPDITLTGSQSVFCQTGTFVFLDGMLDIGANTLVVDGGFANCNTALRGAIVGTAGIQKYGTGSLFLPNNANTYSGSTSIADGTVFLNADNGLGAAGVGSTTSVQFGGTLLVYGNITTPELITLDGGTLENFLGDNATKYQVTLSQNSMVTVDDADESLTLNGVYGVHFLTKDGPGTLVLNGIIQALLNPLAGTLEIDGTSNTTIDVPSGVTLSGNGTLGGVTQIESGGKLKPGTPGNPGTISGNLLSMVDNSQIFLRVGKRSDQIKLTGAFSASGAGLHQFVFVDGDTPPKAGDVYTVAEYASTSGFSAGALNNTYAYIGTGAGDTLLGTFSVGATKMTFTVNTVVSDLVFRSGLER